jgi:hypothetical protein
LNKWGERGYFLVDFGGKKVPTAYSIYFTEIGLDDIIWKVKHPSKYR